MIPKPRRATSQISGRPMKRRTAYKIYNALNDHRQLQEKADRLLNGRPDLQIVPQPRSRFEMEQVLRDLGLTAKESKQLLRPNPLYSFDQHARSIVKVERDIYHSRRRVSKWRRYKVGPRYRLAMNPWHALQAATTAEMDKVMDKLLSSVSLLEAAQAQKEEDARVPESGS